MNTTKKGSSSLQLLAEATLVILLILLMFFLLKGKTTDVNDIMRRNIESYESDFDGDRIKDYFDKSPCVSGEYLVEATDGKTYFYFADAPSLASVDAALNEPDPTKKLDENDFGDKAEEIKNIIKEGREKDLDSCSIEFYNHYFPDLNDNVPLVLKTEQATRIRLCALEEKTCVALLKEHYENLKKSKGS